MKGKRLRAASNNKCKSSPNCHISPSSPCYNAIMEKTHSPSFIGTLSSYTQGATSAIRNTTGSVVAGVGSFVPVRAEIKRPDIIDPTSQEAFEAFKSYNVETNAVANTRRMWAGLIDRVLGYVMFGAAAGAGIAGASALGPVGAAAVFVGALAVSVGAFFFLKQSADNEVTAKSMDVSDFHIRRQAALIGQEIAKEFKKVTDDPYPEKTQAKPYMQARPEVSQVSLQGVQMEVSGQQRLQ